MRFLTLKDLNFRGKRVLMRVDFNVPQNKDGSIADDTRIRSTLPSIDYILKHGGSLVLMSHLGRPKGKDPKFTLAPIAKRLSELVDKPVSFSSDVIGPAVEAMASNLHPGQIMLLENLRFYPGEENPEKDPAFVESLAKLGDLYVNDAFGAAHRAHASTAAIVKFFPHRSAAGLLMEKEIASLSPLLHNPKRPFYAIIGGAKISTKAGVIQNLLKRVDALFVGGGMTYTFLAAQGLKIGDSPFEPEAIEIAKKILASDKKKVHLPSDIVIADAFSNEAQSKTIPAAAGIPDGWQGMDTGPETIRQWAHSLKAAATIFWNGPLGVYEMSRFATATNSLAKSLAQLNATVIVGGGDSVAAIEQMGLAGSFAHLSTGGGATLEFLEFGHLPGIDALSFN